VRERFKQASDLLVARFPSSSHFDVIPHVEQDWSSEALRILHSSGHGVRSVAETVPGNEP
jgi:hypothetical protein